MPAKFNFQGCELLQVVRLLGEKINENVNLD